MNSINLNSAMFMGIKTLKIIVKKAKILSLTNTFPLYLSLIDQDLHFEENLKRLFFNFDAIFIDNPSKLITNEIITSGIYASIIRHIAKGEIQLRNYRLV